MAGQLLKTRLALYNEASRGFSLRSALKETSMPEVNIRFFFLNSNKFFNNKKVVVVTESL